MAEEEAPVLDNNASHVAFNEDSKQGDGEKAVDMKTAAKTPHGTLVNRLVADLDKTAQKMKKKKADMINAIDEGTKEMGRLDKELGILQRKRTNLQDELKRKEELREHLFQQLSTATKEMQRINEVSKGLLKKESKAGSTHNSKVVGDNKFIRSRIIRPNDPSVPMKIREARTNNPSRRNAYL